MSRVRNGIGAVLFGCALDNHAVRRDSQAFKDLLGFDPETNVYHLFPPLLYSESLAATTTVATRSKRNDLFRTPRLKTALKAMLCGPRSIKGRRGNTPHTLAKLWSVQAVTPGAIAFAAIVVRIFLR